MVQFISETLNNGNWKWIHSHFARTSSVCALEVGSCDSCGSSEEDDLNRLIGFMVSTKDQGIMTVVLPVSTTKERVTPNPKTAEMATEFGQNDNGEVTAKTQCSKATKSPIRLKGSRGKKRHLRVKLC